MRVIDLGRGIIVQSQWYDAEEAAAYCHISRATFMCEADRHGLKYTRLGRRRIYSEAELDRLMRLIQAKESDNDR